MPPELHVSTGFWFVGVAAALTPVGVPGAVVSYTTMTPVEGGLSAFVPTSTGPHRLTLVIITVDVPYVKVRIEDPEKTDGRRAPGY